MRIVIAGGGRVGSALAARLVGENNAVTVVERDPAVCKQIFDHVGALTVQGDATDPRVLESAGLAAADIAAGVLARDADNLAFAMLARAMSPARVMARMLDSSYREAYRHAGVRDIIAEADLVVSRIVTSIEFPEVVGSLPLAQGDAVLVEVPIAPRSRVSGKTVAELRDEPGFPRDCLFTGLIDPQGKTTLPRGDTVLQAGHTAILVARREQLAQAIQHLVSRPQVAGEGDIVARLARVDFLAPLSEDELVELARGIELVSKDAGEMIFRKGDPGHVFYLLLSGEVSLLDDNGKLVETVSPGGFFGEIALLTGEPRSTTAMCAKPSQLAAIGGDDFRRVVMGNPAVALEMSRILGQRLASAAQQRPEERRRGLFGRVR